MKKNSLIKIKINFLRWDVFKNEIRINPENKTGVYLGIKKIKWRTNHPLAHIFFVCGHITYLETKPYSNCNTFAEKVEL